MGGYKFYQALDPGQVFEIIGAYFDKKAAWLEHQHRDQKAQGPGHDATTIAQLATAGQAVAAIVSRRLDPAHPNRENLRRKLSITQARERRGLITPQQAAEQRAEVERANYLAHARR